MSLRDVKHYACLCCFYVFIQTNLVTLAQNLHTDGEGDSNNAFDVEIDRQRYEAGKSQYEVVSHYSKMPEYGKCWMNAIEMIQRGCKRLTDEIQSRLALHYLNCFLELQGRPNYPCSEFQTVPECTSNMADSDKGSYATFFTHTQNICYFLQSQAWHQETQRTISRLAENSANVASQLEESSQLQEKMLHQQNTSLQNQVQLINQATNLSQIIANSSTDVRFMFDEFNKTTQEQKLLIFDVFDRVAKLQSLVLGEFTGFYSIMFYTLSVLISYMLTSTPRTSSARFYLFGIMTLNILVERMALSWGVTTVSEGNTKIGDVDEALLYWRQWWCRQISCVLGLVVLAVCAYRYQDLNVINNQLLMEIRKQNSDLKKFILTGGTPQKENGHAITGEMDVSREITSTGSVLAVTGEAGNTTGYESDDSMYSSESSDSARSDHTFILGDNADVDTSSVDDDYSTAPSNRSSRSSTPALLDELSYLRNSTPVRELSHQQPALSPVYGAGGDSLRQRSNSRRSRSRSTTPVRTDIRPGLQRYFLRERTGHPTFQNPITCTESPETFSKTVKHLARLAVKNSMLARFTVKKRTVPFQSSDDES